MHNSKPTVSVIMPAYNSAKYIAEAIESVLAQTYPVLEIIVVDDGSTDDTAKAVQECIRAQERKSTRAQVRYIYQENRGPAAARNNGIRAAKGEYIAFLDSDDIWLPEKLEKQINKLIENSEYYLIHTNRIRINMDGIPGNAKKRKMPEGWVFNKLLKSNFICTSSVLVEKSCFDKVGMFDESEGISEDYDMWLRIAKSGELGFIDQPLVKYRINSNGYSRLRIDVAYGRELRAFLKALPFCEDNREGIKKERIHMTYCRMGNSFFDIKDYQRASFAFKTAVKMKVFDMVSISKYILSKISVNLNRGR